MDVPRMLLPSLSRPRSGTERTEFVIANCSRQGKKKKVIANLSFASKLLTPYYAKKRIIVDIFPLWKEVTFLNCDSKKPIVTLKGIEV